ncbi:cytoplasmic protein [Lysinibacillus sp. FJAT-14745]|uniref:DUF4037 domain-containing protein n=1 Tax=Lysinibacillus sp. FJAT-14745 TaxID=1704289 RepID=UPI0006ABB195|nr:DUF4037 domain-containing protein [Lysinibacillus sp. FJAT-14745]KOP70299.1 cytoplasmic protein [Lysinibacillus sp. FJAT-14745]
MFLLQKSKDMAEVYMQNPKIEAIILAGSVSRNLQDENSDIELHILWSTPPEEEDRKFPIKKIDGTILAYHPYEEEAWSESYLMKEGIKLEISNFLSSTVERFISNVVEKYETDYDKQCIVASIYDGVSLYGNEKIRELKNRVVEYPLELSKHMISENLWLGNRWNNRKALLKRKDWLMLYDVICEVQKKLLGVLFGMNKMYVHHPAFKWMQYSIEQMRIKPKNLYDRMTNILLRNPEQGLYELEVLIEEVLILAENYFPELNISEQMKQIGFVK